MLGALPTTTEELFKLGTDLVQSGNFRALAALLIFAVVKYGSPFLALKAPFWGTGKGKATLVIVTALVTGLFDAFQPGVVPATAFLFGAVKNALVAAGGFSLAKPFFEKAS